jgi:hypothetical protein
MKLSIQPLDSHGQPIREPTLTTWADFVTANDGFEPQEQVAMFRALTKREPYTLGGGAAGAFRISRVG